LPTHLLLCNRQDQASLQNAQSLRTVNFLFFPQQWDTLAEETRLPKGHACPGVSRPSAKRVPLLSVSRCQACPRLKRVPVASVSLLQPCPLDKRVPCVSVSPFQACLICMRVPFSSVSLLQACPFQTLKSYFSCHIYCAHLWPRVTTIVIASCAVSYDILGMCVKTVWL